MRRCRKLEETAKRGDSLFSLLATYHPGDKIKNDLFRPCWMYGRQEKHMQSFGGEI